MGVFIAKLRNSCFLAALANAVMTLRSPYYSSMQSWDGINYSLNGWEGTRATISFSDSICVGASMDIHSPRARENIGALDYFNGAPPEVLLLAKDETLQYLLSEKGQAFAPEITAAFWIINDTLYSVDTSSDMFANGIGIFDTQMNCSDDDALEYWKKEYNMSEGQIEFVKYVYEIFKNESSSVIQINANKHPEIFIGEDITEGIASLQELGIIVSF